MAPYRAIARAFRRSISAPPTVKCPDPQPSCTRRMDAVIICSRLSKVLSNSRKRRFLHGTSDASRHVQVPTKRLPSSPPRLLCRSPGQAISIKPELSQTVLILGDEAHSGSYQGSYGLTRACFTHRHRRHALPLHTCSNTTPPKHSPAQNGQVPPLGDPGSLWLVTELGSSAAISRSRHDSMPTASFDARLVGLLWPQPPLTCSSHHDSTLGPLIPVVAACVKDARPSRWLAPLQRPRWLPPPSGWTRHQPRCFRHERVGWRGSAGDVWLLLGARTWRTSGCPHLLSAPVRTCSGTPAKHRLPRHFFYSVTRKGKKRTAPQAPAGGRKEMGREKGRNREGRRKV